MDTDDLKLLNDIALIDQQLEINSPTTIPNSCKTDVESEDSSDVEPGPLTQPVAEIPKQLNLSCQKVLRDLERKFVQALEENLEKQKTIVKYLNDSNKRGESADDSSMCKLIRCAGIFYFKDFYGYSQPMNEDVKEKLSYGELLCADYLTNSCVWSKQDKECLKKAIGNEIKAKEEKSGVNAKEKKFVQDRKVSIDWMKISAADMNGKYSASECEAQWKLHLSPDVNKSKWSTSEIDKLNCLAKKHKYQDWDAIANELGTNRSGYQCCIQYQTKNSLNEGKWTPEEDDYLEKLVGKFRINNQIPWVKISWYFQTRSRKQCQDRYLEHLRKDLKKGQFSPAEDKIIISGAKIFKDFGKLAKFLPGRAPTQIRSRYYYLIGKTMTDFTQDEDKLLLSLVKKHSKNWLLISEHFPNRSKLQCRKRYDALRKETREGLMPDIWGDIQECKKVMDNKLDKKVYKGKNKKKRRAHEKAKNIECDIYSEMIKYHENCSENYFGPRLRNPATEEELNQLALNLRTTMAMLSVSCDLSKKTEIIESLQDDCNFDSYDKKLLNKLAEEDATGGTTLKDNYALHGMLIPPNRTTLTGCYTMMSGRAAIKFRTREVEGLPQTSSAATVNQEDDDERLSCSRAKALFKSRMKSLLSLPLLLNEIPTDDLCQEFYHKGKTKKPKKMTRKRLRNHAREMNAAHREKRRKMAEEEAAAEQGTACGS